MSTNLAAIYEGNGVLRLLDPLPDLMVHQEVQIEIILPEAEFDWGEPYNPSAEAVWQGMGILEIEDQFLAEWLAFSPDAAAPPVNADVIHRRIHCLKKGLRRKNKAENTAGLRIPPTRMLILGC